MKVLLVDDDVDLLDLTTYALRREGYQVLGATDGEQALRRWGTEHPDIVVLDVNLPKLSGFEVCRRIRQASETPVIMLTAYDDEDDVIRGLELGADDYVTKPFSAKLLAARMRTVLRRATGDTIRPPVSQLELSNLVIDLHSHEVRVNGNVVHTTGSEFRVLYMLAMNEGRVVPYASLSQFVRGEQDSDGGRSGALKTHISHLRRKLALACPSGARYTIRAVSGAGYTLTNGDGPAG